MLSQTLDKITRPLKRAILRRATTAVTIIVLKRLQCKYNENALALEIIVEGIRRASQAKCVSA